MNKNYPLLSQERLPLVWKLFQWSIGGTTDKQKLALKKYTNQKEVLGVGCSVGNVSKVFLKFPDIHYTGLDIDENAIQVAKKDFAKHHNFSFICSDLNIYADSTDKKYDYILFEGVAHHVDDEGLYRMFCSAQKLLSKNGRMVVVDPVTPRAEDNWFIHLYQKLERGQFVRPFEQLKLIIQRVPNLSLIESEECVIGATPMSVPASCRFGIFCSILK